MNGQMKPAEIEKNSFAIITAELGDRSFPGGVAEVVKRVIHTSADFDYADKPVFFAGCDRKSQGSARGGRDRGDRHQHGARRHQQAGAPKARRQGALPDGGTRMWHARQRRAASPARPCPWSTRRSWTAPLIFAIGNAPTALIRLHELIGEGAVKPALVIGVPVGFVNVVESKELFLGGGHAVYHRARAQGRLERRRGDRQRAAVSDRQTGGLLRWREAKRRWSWSASARPIRTRAARSRTWRKGCAQRFRAMIFTARSPRAWWRARSKRKRAYTSPAPPSCSGSLRTRAMRRCAARACT